jgi:poly(3-hydroxybutyrate) depolymerase
LWRERRPFSRAAVLTFAIAASFCLPGCSVPQPRGRGLQTRQIEPRTKRGFWLYLPETYLQMTEAARRDRRWPVVVTFHGMKPFDNAHPQAREWQQEADRYGYITIAPELRAPDVLRQFPVRTVTSAFKSDELATLAILDHVFATTDADPSNVLSTSFSSGGYMAHYMVNQHPSRFTALVARQSNFSATIMEPAKAPRSRYHPILITNTQKDFGVCLRESAEAIRWYESHGYSNVWWIKIKSLAHVRTPDIAADFFGRVAGVGPSRPSTALAKRELIDGNQAGIQMLAGKLPEFQHPPELAAGSRAAPVMSYAATPARGVKSASPWKSGGNLQNEVVHRLPRSTPTPQRTRAAVPMPTDRERVSVRVSSAVGIDPLYIGFSVDCPSDWIRTAEFLWTLDGKELCSGVNGQKTLTKPGTYDLAVRVTTASGKTHHAQKNVRVLPRLRRTDARGGQD